MRFQKPPPTSLLPPASTLSTGVIRGMADVRVPKAHVNNGFGAGVPAGNMSTSAAAMKSKRKSKGLNRDHDTGHESAIENHEADLDGDVLIASANRSQDRLK